MQTHDIARQVRQLEQALASDKVAVAILLGAGCGSSIRISDGGVDRPLIPDIAGLTCEIGAGLGTDGELRAPYDAVLRHLTDDGNRAPNVEDILSHVRTLRQAAGKSEARGLKAEVLEKLDSRICRITQTCVDKVLPDHGTGYHRLASWISSIRREHAVEAFTTNYDLLMEQALEAQHVPYFDGFVGSRRAFFDPSSMITDTDRFPSHWCRLWKLHGSVNWWRDSEGVVSRGATSSGVAPLIHPSHLKYEESRRMPYLAMIDRLRGHFRRTRAVVVTCGFSFADQHLNEVLDEGLQGNPTSVCFGLLHGELTKHTLAVRLAQKRSNMNLWARDRAVVGTKEGYWSLPQQTETPPPWWAELLEAKKEPKAEGERRCQFRLGDFACFGELLAEQMGSLSME
jgi:hypothetical protein